MTRFNKIPTLILQERNSFRSMPRATTVQSSASLPALNCSLAHSDYCIDIARCWPWATSRGVVAEATQSTIYPFISAGCPTDIQTVTHVQRKGPETDFQTSKEAPRICPAGKPNCSVIIQEPPSIPRSRRTATDSFLCPIRYVLAGQDERIVTQSGRDDYWCGTTNWTTRDLLFLPSLAAYYPLG